MFSPEKERRYQQLKQRELEKVAPRLEVFRPKIIGGDCPEHIRIKGVRGGRGAGAKSHSLTSLIVQVAHYYKKRVACFREIQGTLEESVYHLIQTKVDFLRYKKWDFKKDHIDSPAGSHFIFKGLKDLRASRNIKGLEGFQIFFIEEAATISMESWNLLLPTLMRNPDAELWFCYNPEEEVDPVTEKIWNRNRPDALCLEMRPGNLDNPWWNDGLQTEMELDYQYDPDEAEHIWGGQPRKQGINSVLSRAMIRQSMDRNIQNADGAICVGVDVARFGDDKSKIYIRKGHKVINRITINNADTIEIAEATYNAIKRDPSIKVKVDVTGIGAGVYDQLKKMGCKVYGIDFGSNATDKDKYGNCASEMWFNLDLTLIDIPDDPQLMRELSGRRYDYDSKGRRLIESKKEYKKRLGHSPDDADALILCFYEGKSSELPEDIRSEIAARRR